MSDEIFKPCGSADGRAGSMNPPSADDFGRGERVERGESLTTDFTDYTDLEGREDFNTEAQRHRADPALPAGWRLVRLSEIGEVCMCKRVMKSETTTTGEIPFYKIGTFGKQADAFISRALYESYRGMYSYPKKGDVLISAAGTIGRTVVFDGADSYFQDSNIVWLDNDESQVTNEYLHWCYQVTNWQTEDGGIVERLYNGNFNATTISLPPLPEQRAIAGVLGRVDRLVDNLAKRIAKKKAIKQGVMADLLTGKRRLAAANDGRACRPATADGRARTPAAPHGDDFSRGERVERGESLTTDYADLEGREDFNTEAQRHREDAALPAGWRMTTIRESTTVKARIGWQGLTTVEYLKDGPHYLVTGVDIENGRVTWDTCFFVNDSRYQQDKHIQLRAGDVLVSKDGTIGKVAFVESLPRSATLNSGVFVIRSATGDLDQEYLARVFLSDWFDVFIKKITAGSTIAHLYQKDIVNFAFPLPPLPEQRAIAGVLGAMDAEIAKLEAKKAKIERLKQGLMSDLLSGKVRINEDLCR